MAAFAASIFTEEVVRNIFAAIVAPIALISDISLDYRVRIPVIVCLLVE